MKMLLMLTAFTCLAACSPEPAEIAPGDEHEKTTELEHTRQMPGIETVKADTRALQVNIPAYGTLAPNADSTRNVSARFAGVVTRVSKTVGDKVAAGETLASVESNESLQVYAVKSPIAGTITARHVSAGESVDSQTLFTVSDLSTVWAELSIFPRELGKVRVGQQVLLRSGDGALSADSRISHIAPASMSGTQAVIVRAPVINTDHRWRPGLNVSASIVIAQVQAPVAIRTTALQTVDGQRSVFVPHEGGFAPRPVQTGMSDEEYVEIVSGLAAGESYVATDSFLVKAELEKSGASHEH